MPSDPPAVPEERLREEGWVRIESSEDTLASLPIVTVTGHTVVYGDERLRESVAEATEPALDQPWRFFFAARLTFSPEPPARLGPGMLAGIVRSRAREGFAARLRDRGYDSVSEGRTEEIRVRTGDRAQVTSYSATDAIEHGDRTISLPVEGQVGVWHTDGSFRVAGGAYPATDLGDALGVDVDTDPSTCRSELLGLLREVA